MLHRVHTTAPHNLYLWCVRIYLHSGKIGFATILWSIYPADNIRMCYYDYVSIVSCSGALQECVKIHLFVKSLTPKINTHIKWDIILTRISSFLYAWYSTRSNFKFKAVAKSFIFFFKKLDWKTHVETHVQKHTKKFKKDERWLKLKQSKHNLNNNTWIL